jgi:hypothetical protein
VHRIAVSHFFSCFRFDSMTIDYRCDDEKNYWVGVSFWCHCVAEDSKESKNAGYQPTWSPCSFANSKELSCRDCQSPTPTSRTLPHFFLGNESAD